MGSCKKWQRFPLLPLYSFGGVNFGLFVCLAFYFAITVQQESILVAVSLLTPKFLMFREEFTDCLCSGTAVNSKINWFCTPNLHAMGWVSPVVENIRICYGSIERKML